MARVGSASPGTAALFFLTVLPGPAPAQETDSGEPIGPGVLGLPPELPIPEDNPSTPERRALGERLFFDPVLSLDRTISCSSCHRPERGFADDRALSLGVNGTPGRFNAPSLLNRGYGRAFMWDGRFGSLEEQALEPIENELELALGVDRALERIADDASYVEAFEAAFTDGIGRENLARALASYVRGLTFAGTRVDRFRELGDHAALEPAERTGLWIYESKGGCWKCHVGANFTDESFHNTGVGALDGEPRPGRFAFSGDEADVGRFKTPSLRGVALSAPYMHDGSLATLGEVVEFYRRGGGPNRALDPRLVPLELSDAEAAALVAFLEALSERP